jgi:ferredoxin--NADP+ reductase
MIEDLARDVHLHPEMPSPDAAEQMLRDRQPRYVSYADWRRLNALEIERGRALGRPRLKFTRVEDMLAALGR